MSIRPSVLALALGVLAAGCRHTLIEPPPIVYQVEPVPGVVGCPASGCAPEREQIAITYLGVSGYLIQRGDAVLLTAPLFTNPPLRDVLPTSRATIRPDTQLVERLLPERADAASLLLVGHAHYDHLLDVPYIARRRARAATILGSPTTRHILMGDRALRAQGARVVAIDSADVGDAEREGRWFWSRDSAFRVMALRADHAPTFRAGGLTARFASGRVDHDLDTLPAHADDWKLGEPLAYLIDVMARGDARPRLRIYFQDAPNTPPLGFPPRAQLAARGVDVALLCAATARNTPDTPDRLVAYLRPGYAIVGHWESFFRPQTLPIALNPATDADHFLGALTRTMPLRSEWVMPLPRRTVWFNPR